MPDERTWTCPRCGLHVTETPPDRLSTMLVGACPRCGLQPTRPSAPSAASAGADPRRVRVSEARRQQPA